MSSTANVRASVIHSHGNKNPDPKVNVSFYRASSLQVGERNVTFILEGRSPRFLSLSVSPWLVWHYYRDLAQTYLSQNWLLFIYKPKQRGNEAVSAAELLDVCEFLLLFGDFSPRFGDFSTVSGYAQQQQHRRDACCIHLLLLLLLPPLLGLSFLSFDIIPCFHFKR